MFIQSRIVTSVLTLIVLGFSFSARAQTTLHVRINDGTSQDTSYTSGADVPPISVNSSTTKINVWVTPTSTTNLGAITLTLPSGSSAPSTLAVVIGPQTGFPIDQSTPIDPANFGCLDWAGIMTDSSDVQASIKLLVGLHGNLTGVVTVGRVFRIQTGSTGEIRAAITGTNSNSGTDKPVEFVIANKITSAGSVRSPGGSSNNGDITAVTIGAGGIQGTISATQGGIGTIRSTGPISITTPGEIYARDSIVSINAAGQDISANITGGWPRSHSCRARDRRFGRSRRLENVALIRLDCAEPGSRHG